MIFKEEMNKKEEKGDVMNTVKKMLGVWALVVFGLALLGSEKAWADGSLSPLGSTDTIKLFVTPAVNYGVTISSVDSNVGYDFGTVNLNSVTHSTSAILVTNTGNVNENWMLRGGNSANWSLSSSTGVDTAVLMGVFASSTTTTEIATTQFDDGTDEILTTNQHVVYGDGGRYNLNSSHVIATGGVSPLAGSTFGKSRSLWLKLKMPSSSSVATQQQFRLYVVTAAP
jgi:hypothetical protein